MNDRPRHDSSEHRSDAPAATRVTAAIRFRIGGLPRFLSHADTQRVFERACVRAGIPVRYSEGFNPHPRLSLPLPRPVGVESQEELLVVRLTVGGDRGDAEAAAWKVALQQGLAAQLPAGITVLDVTPAASNASFHPQAAEYVLPLRTAGAPDVSTRLQDRIAQVMAGGPCLVERTVPQRQAARRVDIRPFLRRIRLEGPHLVVEHEIRTAGSVRVEEIMRLFGLQPQDLAGPVRRTNVTWGTTP
jgi:radical SAM-linked protein